MSIVIGWWIIPLFLSILIFLWHSSNIGGGMIDAVIGVFALAGCAIVWAVYFAIRYFVLWMWGV